MDLSREIGELHADVRTLMARTTQFDERLIAIERHLARAAGAEGARRGLIEGLKWLASLAAGVIGAEGALRFFHR